MLETPGNVGYTVTVLSWLLLVGALHSMADDTGCAEQCKYTPSVRSIQCPNLSLLHVPQSSNCWEASALNLTNNRISSLQENDFESFTGLVNFLSLSGNNIATIHDSPFRDLTRLKTLILSDNLLVNLREDTFKGLASLETLKLNHNKITRIDESGIFEDLINVVLLDLEDNDIEYVGVRSFRGMTKLNQLYLRNNTIKRLLNDTFDGLSEVEELDLSKNSIRLLEIGAFKHLNNLKKLNLSFNELVSVSAIHDLRLVVLDLHTNNIVQLNADLKGRLQSTHYTFDINVSSNPLSCDCSIEPLRLWYTNPERALSNGGNVARCDSPASLNGSALSSIKKAVICSGIVTTTSQTMTSNANGSITSSGNMVADIGPKQPVGWTHPLLGVMLGFIGFGFVIVVVYMSYRRYKRFTRNTARPMLPAMRPAFNPLSSRQVRPPPPNRPPPSLRRPPAVAPRPPTVTPRPPVRSQRNRSGHHLPACFQVNGYITHVKRSRRHPQPTDGQTQVARDRPPPPSAVGHLQITTSRPPHCPSFLNHTIRHNYSNRISFTTTDGQSRPLPSEACTYLSLNSLDSVSQPSSSQQHWRSNHANTKLRRPEQLDLLPDLTPDKPEFGVKLDRHGNVKILPINEFLHQHRNSGLYVAV